MIILRKISNFRFTVPLITRQFSKKSPGNLHKLLKTMPKEPKHIAEAQKQRIKIKQKNSKYVPGRVTLQILGTGAKGAPRSVYLFSDQNRYLFNCGEGTQRLAHEHKTKLSKLEHIFITHPSWKNIGGLPGTALTIQDVGVPEITLHGPEGINEIFPATRRFVILKDLKVKVADCNESNHFEDNVMSVKYVPLFAKLNINTSNDATDQNVEATVEQNDASTSTRSERKRSRRRSSSRASHGSSPEGKLMKDDTDYYAHEQGGKRTLPENVQSINQNIRRDTKEKHLAMCYVCRLQPRPGTLNLDKCVEKGVTPGPLLGRLKNGEDVTLPNGTIVNSKEVCEPDDPGPLFIVIDCPSPEYLESLVTNLEITKHQNSAQSDDDVASLVVHFTPKEVMELPEYQHWMDNFSVSTEHIPVNEINSCMGSIAVHRIQYKLNMLSEELFPLLGDHGSPAISEAIDSHQVKRQKCDEIGIDNLKINSSSISTTTDLLENHNLKRIGCLTSFHLRPKKGIDSCSRVQLNPQEYINETTSLEAFPDALKELEQKISLSKSKLTIREYPRVIFLGTGSCIPNKTRNTSGIMLRTSESNVMLMDCGEGTCGQIIRFFGPEKSHEILAKIKAVYISHLHADHHIGLIGLLQGRRKAMERLKIDHEPLYLFAPQQILAWLYFYDRYFEDINDYVLIANGDLILNENSYPIKKKNEILGHLELSDINTCLVKHCPNAYGVSIIHKSGYKITYSGDTMPCEQLIELGKNCDVLIHEATMEDELEKEAIIKLHSTTSQAIQVGKDMQARNIILTHFSQRYSKLPRFNDNFAENVSIAFDNMQIRLDELPLVPLMYPALKIMFAEHYEELEHKSVKRQLKSERQASLGRTKLEQKS